MYKNIEIEFKTEISFDKYQELLKHFNLENNIFKQINYYFDTDNFDLNQKKMVLRIRQKSDTRVKVTLKSQSEQGAFESHVILTKDQADDMIRNGFNTKDFFEELDYFVKFRVSLDNFRVSTPFEGGTLFLDRCEYCNIVDYEVEYEVDHYDDGIKMFEKFLNAYDIRFVQTRRKSERAFICKR